MTDMNAPEKPLLHKARVETLVDGVFAIAMTILVLELKVPEGLDRRAPEPLLHALLHHLPVVLAYLFSFFLLAVIWVWHHRLTEKMAAMDRPVLVCVMVLLSMVCAFPFAAALLGRYPANPVSLAVYMPVLAVILLSQTAMFWLARRRGLLQPNVSAELALAAHRRNVRGLAMFLLCAIPAALRLHWSAATVCGALGVLLMILQRGR